MYEYIQSFFSESIIQEWVELLSLLMITLLSIFWEKKSYQAKSHFQIFIF